MAEVLPEKLIFEEILSRVPAKVSIEIQVRFEVLAHSHLVRSPIHQNPSQPLQISPTRQTHWRISPQHHTYFDPNTGEHFFVHLANILNEDHKSLLTPLGSRDGLPLTQSTKRRDPIEYCVCNPITRHFAKLPPPPWLWLHPCDIVFDSTVQRYKVVSWSRPKACAVFTLDNCRDGSWRVLGLPFECLGDYVRYEGVVSNGSLNSVVCYGALNWVAQIKIDNSWRERKCVVLSMDIGREEIKEIRLPSQECHFDVNEGRTVVSLMEVNECLCAVFKCPIRCPGRIAHVWVLEDWAEQKWRMVCELERTRIFGPYKCVKTMMMMISVDEAKRIEEKMVKINEKEKRLHPFVDVEHVNTLVSGDCAQCRKPKRLY